MVEAGFPVGADFLDLVPSVAVEPSPPSLVTEYGDNAHKTANFQDLKRAKCENMVLFRESCGHGNYRTIAKPCDRWGCAPCADWRIETELIPEIERAFRWSMELGETLKHVVLTWKGEDPGAQPTREGANRRRLDIQHLAQWFRRDQGQVFEYLRVAETHKKGTVHVHLIAVTPFVDQKVLSNKWKSFARNSFRVTVQALGMKCSRCWPAEKMTLSMWEKRRRIIIPPPGNCTCSNCGYRVDPLMFDWDHTIKSAVAEMAKYLTKEAVNQGIIKKLNRTKGWNARCRPADQEKEPCTDCDEVHGFRYYGKQLAVWEWAENGVQAPLLGVVYYPNRGGECGCWKDAEFWPSACDSTLNISRVGVTVERFT